MPATPSVPNDAPPTWPADRIEPGCRGLTAHWSPTIHARSERLEVPGGGTPTAHSCVGEPPIRKTLVLLQSILERAVEWRRSTPTLPARSESRASAALASCVHSRRRRSRRWRAPPAARTAARCNHDRGARLRRIASGEALGLRWHDVGERTILVERSVAFGQLKPTKTGQARTVRLLGPLADTLKAWRRVSLRPTPTDLISPPPTAHRGTPTAPSTDASYVRGGRCRGRRAAHPPVRPAPQLHQSADRSGRHRRWSREAGRAQPDDGTQHLRPLVRRARRWPAHLGRGPHPRSASRREGSGSVRFVSASPRPTTLRLRKSLQTPMGDPGLEPGTSSL
jgi:hypothetical protein